MANPVKLVFGPTTPPPQQDAPPPARAVGPLFAPPARRSAGNGPLFADAVGRARLAVTAADLSRMFAPAGATERACADAADQLRFVRVETLSAETTADFGVAPQADLAEAANHLLALGSSAELAQINRDVDQLLAEVEAFTHWWNGATSTQRLARIEALAARLRASTPRLDGLADDARRLDDRLRRIAHELAVQLVMVMYLQTPTTPPVPADAVAALAVRQASLNQSLAAVRLAAGEVGLVLANVTQRRVLVNSAVLNAVPAWCLGMVRADAAGRRNRVRQLLEALRAVH